MYCDLAISKNITYYFCLALIVALLLVVVAFPSRPASKQPRRLHDKHVLRQGNIFSLSKAAWSLEDTSHDPPTLSPQRLMQCNAGAFYKFHGHGCCLQKSSSLQKSRHVVIDFSIHELLQTWSNRRIVFIGDSITQQALDALLNNAYTEGISNVTKSSVHHQEQAATFLDYNVTIGRIGDGGGISPIHGVSSRVTYSDTPQVFEAAVHQSDTSIVNFGLHLDDAPEESWEQLFTYVRTVLEADMTAHPHKQHLVRLTFPQHFVGKDGKGHDYRQRANDTCVDHGVDTEEHYSSVVAKQVFRGSSVKVLDYSDFLEHCGDLHSIGNRKDCSHWCWDYEMWRGVYYLTYIAYISE